MANWSETSYVLVGDKEQLDALYCRMSELENMCEPIVPEGVVMTSLRCLVSSLGADPGKVYCRGNWYDLRRDADSLSFNCGYAWSRPNEVEDLIRSVYPGIDIYFIEEELGTDIFRTNDIGNSYFLDTVIIDIEDEGLEYYNDSEALAALSEMKGATAESRFKRLRLGEIKLRDEN